MSRRPTKPEPKPADLSINEIKAGLRKLRRRLGELNEFKPEEAVEDDSISTSLEDKIDHTLIEIFGSGTLDYKRYKVYSLYEGGSITMGGGSWTPPPSLQEKIQPYIDGKQSAISKINTAIEVLEEKIQDAEEAGDSGAPLALDGYDLHPALQAAAGNLYKNGHYAQAIEAACKALNAQVQAKSGNYEKGETKLMDTVFSANNPVLAFNDMQGESDKDEQQGLMFIYKGAFLAFRNPRAHKLVEDDPQTAFGVIRFIDFLIKMLDKTTLKPSN